jgi:hypothetical protein
MSLVPPRALQDPSHLPFAHHGVFGMGNRYKAQPIAVSPDEAVNPQVPVTPPSPAWGRPLAPQLP